MAATASVIRSAFCSGSVRNVAARVTSQAQAAPSPFWISTKKPLPLRSFRPPVELSFCVESMLPLHYATASALLNSMLSPSCSNLGRLSEGDTVIVSQALDSQQSLESQ